MKLIKNVSLLLLSAIVSLPVLGNEISDELKSKISEALQKMTVEEENILNDGGSLILELDNQDFELNLNLVEKLENDGILDRNTVAGDGARCTGRN